MKENYLKTKVLLVRAVTVLLLAVSGTGAAWGKQVTAEEALQQAQAFFSNHQSAATGVRRAPGIAPQLKAAGQVSGLYVFNVTDGGGFVIVSNDDATIPILGYSDNGSIDPNHMPDNLRAWLQGYADQIAWLNAQEKQGEQKVRRTQRKVQQATHSTDPITPLLSTTWGQDSPYNLNCPTDCPTGCVATAMAQVMYYTETKADNTTTTTTNTIPSYQTTNYGSMSEIAAGTTLYWSSMKTNYSGEYTEEQAQAVATLMQCCGYSVEANYGPGGTQAQTHLVANALQTYFGYSSTTQYVSRSFYSYANWVALLYNELSQGRPVLYNGSSVDNGHAFICDGYMYQGGTDMFHINWGWNGLSDSYFALTALDPENQGTGGNASGNGYNFCQGAIVGIQKTGGTGTVLNLANTVNLTLNSISVDKNSVGLGEIVNFTVRVTNNSNDPYDGDIVFYINENISYGYNVTIPAHKTQDCVIPYETRITGENQVMPLIPDGTGLYATNNDDVCVTLYVDNATPVHLTASDIDFNSANIDWTSGGTAESWNVRYRPLTITKADFNDCGLPSGWKNWNNNTWGVRELGLNNYCLSSAATNPCGLIIPNVTLGGSLSLRAWGQDATNYAESFAVYVYDGEYYTQVSSQYVTTHTPELYHIDLSGYSGTTNIAIIHLGGQSYLNIDDITIVEPAGGWTTVQNITTKPYSLTGLNRDTYYEVQAQAAFTEGTTNWSEPLIFSTQNVKPADIAVVPTSESALISWTGYANSYKVKYRAAAIDYVLYDDFENWNEKGWIKYGDGFYSFTEEDNHFIGLGFASTDTQYLITPELNNLGNGTILNFYQRYYQSGTTFQVGFSSTTSDTGAFTWGSAQTASGSFTLYGEEIPAGTKYVAIKTTAAAPANTLIIDNFSIGTVANWTTISSATSPYEITGLQANTAYDYQIIGVYNNEEVASDVLSFTTTDAAFELADDDRMATTKNADLIAAWNGRTATVTLSGRRLFKDGDWNTICLPFNVVDGDTSDGLTFTGTPLEGAIVKQLDTEGWYDESGNRYNVETEGCKQTGIEDDCLYLNFADATSIEAGKPYLIKWKSGENITNPVFTDVKINATVPTVSFTNGSFNGIYDSRTFTKDDRGQYLLLGSDNTLYYAGTGAGIGACRAYFQVPNGSAGIKAFNLNIDGSDTTEITDTDCTDQTDTDNGWWTLSGVRLNGKPTEKGVYLFNGKKVVVQ